MKHPCPLCVADGGSVSVREAYSRTNAATGPRQGCPACMGEGRVSGDDLIEQYLWAIDASQRANRSASAGSGRTHEEWNRLRDEALTLSTNLQRLLVAMRVYTASRKEEAAARDRVAS